MFFYKLIEQSTSGIFTYHNEEIKYFRFNLFDHPYFKKDFKNIIDGLIFFELILILFIFEQVFFKYL